MVEMLTIGDFLKSAEGVDPNTGKIAWGRKTIVEIVERPENETEAVRVFGELVDRVNPHTRGVINGEDLVGRRDLDKEPDPKVFYIVEG